MDCGRCGHGNAEGTKFCGNCGKSLQVLKTCVACGSQLQPGEKICSACAAKVAAKKEKAVTTMKQARSRAQEIFFRALPNLLDCHPVSVGHYFVSLVRGFLAGFLAFVFVSIGMAELFGGVKLATFIGALAGIYALLRIDGHVLVARAVEIDLPRNKPLLYLGMAGLVLTVLGGFLHFSVPILGLLCLFSLALVIGMQEERFQ